MPILRAMDGKFYDVPDDQAASFEVPREKVKELLEKAGVPAPQGGQGQQPGPQQGQQPHMNGQRPPGGGAAPHAPVVVQIFAAPHGAGAPPPQQQQQHAPQEAPEGADGEVDPYWFYWWRNYYIRPWMNYWGNY